MKILLDSNAYSLLMRGHGDVAALVRRAEEVLFSAVVVGELMYGFRRGKHFERNAAHLRSFLDNPYTSFVAVGPVTADRYSRIAAALRAKGRPIPTNDVWIAAHAMETGADLVSADAHFEHVEGVVWVRVASVPSDGYTDRKTR
ncbi:MAG: type II toxin-antitoxin system VapC family toxin [Caldilineaceae bacterium SB0661_bin_34]|nr:type II toxin-antitoxin system VapC family toxin [Caldilineaceae bacterium SB0661_bin_34]